MSSPTQRTLACLKRRGFTAGIVEKHIPFPKPFGTKQDFLGIIDVIACKPDVILGVQTTSSSNAPARVNKALAIPELIAWLRGGGTFEVWGWSKRLINKRPRWSVRRLAVTVAFLQGGSGSYKKAPGARQSYEPQDSKAPQLVLFC